MAKKELRFTKHSLERLFERKISPEDCLMVFNSGTTIETYPDDKPFPSRLIVGKVRGRFIHLVIACGERETFHVITGYEPEEELWDSDCTKRKQKRSNHT